MKISEFPDLETITDDCLFLVYDPATGTTRKTTVTQLKSVFGANSGGGLSQLVPFEFQGKNSAIQGNWGGTFGTKGYILCFWDNGTSRVLLPASIGSFSLSGGQYNMGVNDVRALPGQSNNLGERKSYVCYGGNPGIQVIAANQDVAKVAIYGCDFDNGRGDFFATITSSADATKTATGTLTEGEFNAGGYLQFSYQGSFQITTSTSSGSNNTFSAIFFD